MVKSDFLQSAENFENICEMFQENTRYVFNAIKRYPCRFIMSLKEIKVVLTFHFVCVLLRFSLSFQVNPIMSH